MKKISIILLAFFIVACSSSSDDSTDSSQDLIIGKWTFDKTVYLLDNQIVEVVAPTLCDVLTSYEFFENKKITIISYIGETNCELEIAEFEYFNWTKLSEEEYKLVSKRADEQNEESRIVIVKFENDNIMFWPDYFEGTTYTKGDPFNERRSYFVKN